MKNYEIQVPLFPGCIIEHNDRLFEWNGRNWTDEDGQIVIDLGLCARLKVLARQSLLGIAS